MTDSEPRSTAGGPAEPQTVGQILRKARAAQELSLEQLAAELRIEPQQLFALEQNQFERIGVPVFVKGYLRQYGQRLGLDHRDLLAVYYKQGKLEEIDIRPSRAIKLRDEQKITGWIVAALILGALLLALAYWWFNGGGSSISPPPPAEGVPAALVEPPTGEAAPGAASAAIVAAPRIEQPPAASPLAPGESSAVAPGGSTPAAAGDTPAVPPSSADGGVAATALPATPAARVTAEPAAAEAAATAVDYTAVLDVTFTESSWTEITDARGARLFYDLGTAGRRVTLRGEPPFSVVLGNAAGVRLNLNGEAYEIPTVGRQGTRLDFTLDIAEE
jgi:cytoskeleton protein RodZ